MSHLLPQIQDRKHYYELFRDDKNWDPAIRHLIHHHHLEGAISRSVLGSHIVYRTGSVWIKLMAPLFAGDMKFEISGLRAVQNKLTISTPQILFEGELEGWKYVVLSHIEGQPIRNIWSIQSDDQKLKLSIQMAQIVQQLKNVPADSVIQNRFQWNDFIKSQYENIESIQAGKELSEPWLRNVKSFISEYELSEFQTANPVFLHADLTSDHFLVNEDNVTGVIDLADCQVGHPDYELLAPASFIFKGQKNFLRHFLIHCGFRPEQLNSSFSHKLMAWTLLHRYCAIHSHFKNEMQASEPGNFKDLAERVYPLELMDS
jgi:hygromycin-B 7''-O-kinase